MRKQARAESRAAPGTPRAGDLQEESPGEGKASLPPALLAVLLAGEVLGGPLHWGVPVGLERYSHAGFQLGSRIRLMLLEPSSSER